MTEFWIGIASDDHVLKGIKGGFGKLPIEGHDHVGGCLLDSGIDRALRPTDPLVHSRGH